MISLSLTVDFFLPNIRAQYSAPDKTDELRIMSLHVDET